MNKIIKDGVLYYKTDLIEPVDYDYIKSLFKDDLSDMRDNKMMKVYFYGGAPSAKIDMALLPKIISYNISNTLEVQDECYIGLFSERNDQEGCLKQLDDLAQEEEYNEILNDFINCLIDMDSIAPIHRSSGITVGLKNVYSKRAQSFFNRIFPDMRESDMFFSCSFAEAYWLRRMTQRDFDNLLTVIKRFNSLYGVDGWDYAFFVLPDYIDKSSLIASAFFNLDCYVLDNPLDLIDNSNRLTNVFKHRVDECSVITKQAFNNNLFRNLENEKALHYIQQRNMDHNIGSHVLSRLAIDLPMPSEGNTQEELSMRFFEYLKLRQSYLLSLTNSYRALEAKNVLENILTPFVDNEYLTNYVSGIDGLKPKLKFFLFGEEFLENTKTKIKLNPLVDFPNGMLGVQAVYNILENIIRNTAKHGRFDMLSKEFSFSLSLDHAEDTLEYIGDNEPLIEYRSGMLLDPDAPPVYIDNSERLKFREKQKESILEQSSALYAFSIYDNATSTYDNISNIADRMNYFLSMPLLVKETNKIRSNAWGLIEMKIAAAYIRSIPINSIDLNRYAPSNKSLHLPLLKAYPKKINEDEYSLAYLFFVNKPKSVLIVSSDKDLSDRLAMYRVEGVEVYEDLGDLTEPYPHKIVIVTDSVSSDLLMNIENMPTSFSRKLLKGITTEDILSQIIIPYEEQASSDKRIAEFFNIFYYNNQLHTRIPVVDSKSNGADRLHYLHALNISKINTEELAVKLNHGDSFWSYVNETDPSKKADYIELFTSSTKIYFNGIDWLYTLALKVLVFDERIQEAADKVKYTPINNTDLDVSPIPYRDLYEFTNIKIPKSENLKLNSSIFTEQYLEEFKGFYRKNSDAFFILIHIEVLEKLISAFNSLGLKKRYKKTATGLLSFLENELFEEEGVPSIIDRVIICSGKGIPSNLPQGMRFIHFSILSDVISGKDRNKYAFTEALFSARKVW